MRRQLIQRICGLLLMGFAATMLPALAIALWTGDGTAPAFAAAGAAIVAGGGALWLPVRRQRGELKLRDGFLVVVMFWTVLGLCGALPLWLASGPRLSVADALFEAVSGLTTTGATVLDGLDALAPSLLFYRALLQWLGGMSIVVLAVAIMPMLGIGGLQFYRADTPAPMKDTRLTPRIAETARTLSYLYVGFTVACALAYHAAGMSVFDAIAHSFATIASGGFSTHDANLGYFDSVLIEGIAVVFMLVGTVNFSLHFLAWRYRNAKPYLFDPEFRVYVGVLVSALLACAVLLALGTATTSMPAALRSSLLHVVSVGTTTGFRNASLAAWPPALLLVLMFLGCIGGCAGSTAGGIKVIRCLLLYKQGAREIHRLIHPNAIINIHLGDRQVIHRVVDAVWGLFATYVAFFVVLVLALMATGLTQVDAFAAVAACLNNVGPALAGPGPHYGEMSTMAKYLLCLAMVLGRLEIFTLLVVLTPSFWRS